MPTTQTIATNTEQIILNQSRTSTSAASAKSPPGDKVHAVGKNIITANAKRLQNLQTKQSNLKKK